MSSHPPSPVPSTVDSSSPTPEQREAAKSPAKRAEDIAYVLNHTGTCLFFDLTGGPPAASALTVKAIKGVRSRFNGTYVPVVRQSLGEWGKGLLHEGKEWWIGEVFGDLGAVPVTIAAQRYAPGLIHHLNNGMSYALGPAYRWGAERSTRHWAKEHGIGESSPEFKAHADRIYNAEVEHLGDAAVWTLTAFPINVLARKVSARLKGETVDTMEVLGGKVAGALWATSGVLAARAFMPAKAQKLDEATSRNLIMPATRQIGRLFGIDTRTINEVAGRMHGEAPKNTVSEPSEIGRLPGTRDVASPAFV